MTTTVYTTTDTVEALEVGARVRVVEALGLGASRSADPVVGTLVEISSGDAVPVLGTGAERIGHPYRVRTDKGVEVVAVRVERAPLTLPEEIRLPVDPLADVALVPVAWDRLSDGASVLALAREDVERFGIRRGDALEVRRCGQGVPGCVETVPDETTAESWHLDGAPVGLPADSDDALLFGVVEDAAEILDRVRARWADARSLVEQGRTLVRSKGEEVERLQARATRLEDDVRSIGSALKETADESDWCGEYDRQVRECAEALQVSGDLFLEVALRRRAYLVDVEVRTFVTVPVEAEDEDDAREQARGLWGEYAYGMDLSTDSLRETDEDSWNVEEDPDRY